MATVLITWGVPKEEIDEEEAHNYLRAWGHYIFKQDDGTYYCKWASDLEQVLTAGELIAEAHSTARNVGDYGYD